MQKRNIIQNTTIRDLKLFSFSFSIQRDLPVSPLELTPRTKDLPVSPVELTLQTEDLPVSSLELTAGNTRKSTVSPVELTTGNGDNSVSSLELTANTKEDAKESTMQFVTSSDLTPMDIGGKSYREATTNSTGLAKPFSFSIQQDCNVLPLELTPRTKDLSVSPLELTIGNEELTAGSTRKATVSPLEQTTGNGDISVSSQERAANTKEDAKEGTKQFVTSSDLNPMHIGGKSYREATKGNTTASTVIRQLVRSQSLLSQFFPSQNRMLSTAVLTLLFLLTLITPNTSSAQVNTYVHSGAKMYVFSEDTMSVWGNATNYGLWGSKEEGVVHFYGATWANSSAATMPGAGTFFFQQPRPAPYANDVKQNLEGGHSHASSTGCSFPDFHLDNANDLYLINSDSKVRDTFNFVDGHVIHDALDFTVGDNDPGEILNYNETQFFVTNGTGTSDIGFLEREGLLNTDQEEAFPIGVAVGDYTPGRIKNIGTQDDFSMRVFSNVYNGGYSGTAKNDASVAKTWDVEERTTGGSNVTLELQHNTATEGTVFGASRTNHYITHHTGSNPNGPAMGNGVDTTSKSEWDLLKFSKLYSGESGTGYITTGTAISGALVTKRANLDAFSPYTKTVYDLTPLPVELISLEGQWLENDAEITWSTATELNNSHYDVERSFNGIDFEYVNSVGSKAEGGNSNSTLQYSYVDQDVKPQSTGEVFYRLIQHDYDGEYEVLGPVVLYTNKTNNRSVAMNVFPNPSQGRVTVIQTGNVNKTNNQITVVNTAGQVVHEKNVAGNNLMQGVSLDLTDMPTGVYMINVRSESSNEVRRIQLGH